MKKNFRGLTLMLAVVAVALTLPLRAQQRQAADKTTKAAGDASNASKDFSRVQSESKLHARTQLAGGRYVMKYKASRSTVYPNVDEVAKRSDLVVVGRVVSHKSSLSADERFITQDFMVKVQEVIKGDWQRSRALLVSLPGGTYRFDDGSFAAMVPVGYRPPQDGGIYVFFLKAKTKDDAGFKGYRLVSESQGLFEFKNGAVQPADPVVDDPVNVKYRQMSGGSFLQQVHRAVPRKRTKAVD